MSEATVAALKRSREVDVIDFLLWFALIWAVTALACVYIADDKGRSVFAWGCLGMLLGPLALIGLLLFPTDYKALEQREIEKGKMRKCPRCREWIKKKATLCRYCGSELASPKG